MASPATQLAHKTRVMHLYRSSLKSILSWAVQRDVWYDEVARVRDEFEKHRNVANPVEAARLVERGEAKLAEYAHPDPYIVPYYYSKTGGGSKYARNPPVPPEIHLARDFGREE